MKKFLFRVPEALRRALHTADLANALVLFYRLLHQPAFLDAVRKRLFTINILSGFGGFDHLDRMPMVGRGNHDCINVFILQ
jgi:hypothetical protein